MSALLTACRRKAVSQDAAFEIGTQLPLSVRRNTLILPVVVAQGKEGLEIILHHPVERCASGTPPAVRNGRASLSLDVIERRRAEQALRENEERLDLALSVANDGIWDWHIDSNTVFFDRRYYTMAGYKPNEFPGNFREWEKRVHPDDIRRAKLAIEQYLVGVSEGYNAEFRFLRKNSDYMWIRAKGKVVSRDEEGNPARFVGAHSDITERVWAEMELHRANEQLQTHLVEIKVLEAALRE